MQTWQKILLIVTVVLLLAVIIFTWGSIASGLSVYCLISMGSAFLVKRFLVDRDMEDYEDFQGDQ